MRFTRTALRLSFHLFRARILLTRERLPPCPEQGLSLLAALVLLPWATRLPVGGKGLSGL